MKGIVAGVFLFFSTIGINAQNLDWAKSMGASGGNTEGKGITTDSQNNVISVGMFGNTVDLDPGTGVFDLTSPTQALYVQKLDAAGNFVWARAITATGYAYGYNSICTDAANNVYIITQYSGTIDCDPGPGTSTFSVSTSSNSMALIKLNSTGDFVYAKSFTGFMPMSMTISNNFVYLSGICQPGTIDFDVNAGTSNYTSAAGAGFIQKLDLSWNMIWVKTFEGLEWPPCIGIDNSGNVLASGHFRGTVDFDPGSPVSNLTADASLGSTVWDIYMLKLTTAGNMVWLKHLTSPGTESVLSLAVDKSSNGFFIGGNKNSGSDLDPSAAVANLPGASAFVAKYDASGAYLWGRPINLQLTGFITSDPAGNVVIIDKFQFAFDADPGPGTATLNAVGSFDMYILKLDGAGNYVWAGVTGGSAFEEAVLHSMDSDGNIYYTGRFQSVADFDPVSTTSYVSASGNYDAFVSKINGCAHNAPDICLVTVDSLANNNVIYWDKSQYPSADSFVVYRYDALTTNYLRVGAVAMSDANNFLIDTARTVGGPNGGDPQYSSYRYKLAIRDICGTLGTKGLYHESIFIQQNFQNFNWNAYGIEGQTSPSTGYQFLRDNNNTGNWQVLVNTGGLSTTDPNYASYPNGNWRVDALGFSCTSTARMNGSNQMMGAINTSRSNIKSPTSVGIKELKKQLNVKAYPNPANDKLTVEIEYLKGEATIALENVLGETVLKQHTGKTKTTVSTENFKSGVYLMKISSGENHAVIKVVIE
ncbi:MAG: hypothetical protein K0S33_3266 [Bacteroidetes bacterium]|jgi:hypothetical protein|nr:hypothetical protein [Bacteroidota bacterium]